MAGNSNEARAQPRWLVAALFCITIFLSASLLFFVQPLFTKIVLPHIGGAPAVWTTAMLFFQTTLIAGYVYAHLMTRYLPIKLQIGIHLSLWALALIFLPLGIAEGWRYDATGAVATQTLILFATGVGLPFAVLSANAPLIQHWYARTGGPSSDDPYFLYGASNLGSLIALLAFPLVAEPFFGAGQIGWGWMFGFWTLGAMLLLSGLQARPSNARQETSHAIVDGPTLSRRLYWGLIAFVPSSLMLAVTTKISTDIGSVPMIWVIPLALFLLTFVLVFTNKPIASMNTLGLFFVVGLGGLAAVFSNLFGVHVTFTSAAISVVAFFLVALYAHALLYSDRPDPAHLTTFYVTMSVGGALGGFFNSVLAPVLFNDLHEGAITVAIGALLLLSKRTMLGPVGITLSLILAALMLGKGGLANFLGPWGFGIVAFALVAGILSTLRSQSQVLALVICSFFVTGQVIVDRGTPLLADRSFFGSHRVVEENGLRYYGNGTTTHGAQRIDDLTADRPEPLLYYHRNSPMAQVFSSTTGATAERVGIVGLGVGALACYGAEGQTWDFYEIDALVADIARDPELFTFMSQCAPSAPVHLGDARMVLADQTSKEFDILVIDAYSSDSVPVHLTTREAFHIYLDHLSEDGVLLFHISNRYYDISRPLGRLAEDLDLTARIQRYDGNKEIDTGDVGSVVVALARSDGALGIAGQDPRWEVLNSDGGAVWTDDFANLLEILDP